MLRRCYVISCIKSQQKAGAAFCQAAPKAPAVWRAMPRLLVLAAPADMPGWPGHGCHTWLTDQGFIWCLLGSIGQPKRGKKIMATASWKSPSRRRYRESGSLFCWQFMAARGGYPGCQKLHFVHKLWDFLGPMWIFYGLQAVSVLVWGISSLTAFFQLVAGPDAITSPKAEAANTGTGITGDPKPLALAGGVGAVWRARCFLCPPYVAGHHAMCCSCFAAGCGAWASRGGTPDGSTS